MQKLPITLFTIILIILNSCITQHDAGCIPPGTATIHLHIYGEQMKTKSGGIDTEDGLSDLNLFVFDSDGSLIYSTYMSEITTDISLDVMYGTVYSIYAIANCGDMTGLDECTSITGLESLYQEYANYSALFNENNCFHLSGKVEVLVDQENQDIMLPLKRLVSKLTLKIDKSKLDSDVSMSIHTVRIYNSNTKVHYFQDSKAESDNTYYYFRLLRYTTSDIFTTGEVFYLPENLQGDLLTTSPSEIYHRPPDGYSNICTYVEVQVIYQSSTIYNGGLCYKFFLHDGINTNNFDVGRNNHYICTIIPVGNGISEESWRVDRSTEEWL